MKTREETAQSFAAPGMDTTLSGLRRLNLASIALLQMTANPYLGVIVDGDPDPHNRLELLKFLYIHSAHPDTVNRVCLAARKAPEMLDFAALRWGQDITPDAATAMIADMFEDKDDIANAATTILPDPGAAPSKN